MLKMTSYSVFIHMTNFIILVWDKYLAQFCDFQVNFLIWALKTTDPILLVRLIQMSLTT